MITALLVSGEGERVNPRLTNIRKGERTVRKSIAILTVGMVAALLVAGCQTSPGVRDKDQIASVLNAWKAGFEAGNIDAIMAPVSDDFTHYEWTTKDTLRAFIEGVLVQGELDNANVDLQYAEYTENADGTWTVYPIELSAVFGSASLEAVFKQEAGTWKIVTMEVEGI